MTSPASIHRIGLGRFHAAAEYISGTDQAPLHLINTAQHSLGIVIFTAYHTDMGVSKMQGEVNDDHMAKI
jgi:D-aminopeptidase